MKSAFIRAFLLSEILGANLGVRLAWSMYLGRIDVN